MAAFRPPFNVYMSVRTVTMAMAARSRRKSLMPASRPPSATRTTIATANTRTPSAAARVARKIPAVNARSLWPKRRSMS